MTIIKLGLNQSASSDDCRTLAPEKVLSFIENDKFALAISNAASSIF